MSSNLSLGIVIGASVSGSVNRAFGAIGAQASGLGRSLQQVRLGRAASDDVLRYQRQLHSLTEGQRQFGLGNTRLWGQIADTERALRAASATAARYGVNVGDITRENQRLLHSEQRLANQLQRSNTLQANRSRRSELGGQVMGVVGMAFAAAAPVKAAIEFESVMADVRKTNDVTDAQLKVIRKDILDMSATMPMAASGIGAIYEAAGQSGIAKNELNDFSKSAIKMGVAFDMSGEEAGHTMANWRAGMGITQKETESLADAINYLDSNMNASAKNISAVVTRQGAVAKAAGFSSIQTAALSAALLNSGTSEEIAATALKNLTNALTQGNSASKAQIEVFKQLGMTSEQVTAGMQKDAEGTIKKVFAALAKTPAEMRGAMVGDLFGEEAKGAIMPLLVNIKALDQAFNSVGDASKYAGSMQKEYNIRSQTTGNAVTILGNQFTRLGINLGSVLLPTLNSVFGVVGSVASGIAGMAEKFPRLTQVVVGAVVGLVALKVATLAGAFAVTLISDGWAIATGAMAFFNAANIGTRIGLAALWVQTVAFNVAQKAMAAVTAIVTAAQWAWNVALNANPIGLVVIGITAFGALAYTVYKNWEPIMKWFRENFTWLGTAVEKVAGYARQVGSVMSSVGRFMTTPVIGGAVAATLAMPAGATPLPSMAHAKAPQAISKTVNITNHITQKPGEDAAALAERLHKKIKQQDAKDKRGALHD